MIVLGQAASAEEIRQRFVNDNDHAKCVVFSDEGSLHVSQE